MQGLIWGRIAPENLDTVTTVAVEESLINHVGAERLEDVGILSSFGIKD